MKNEGPIIVIDDDQEDHELLRLVIQNIDEKQEVKFFCNGKDALAYLSATTDKPLFILSDINMPLVGGLELQRIINENESLKRKSIPFIFFTTSAAPKEVLEAYDLGVQGFFTKPDNLGKLQVILGRIIDYWQACLHPNCL